MADIFARVGDLNDVDWPPGEIVVSRLLLRATRASDRAGFIDLLASEKVRHYLGGARSREELARAAPEVPGAYPGVFAVQTMAGAFIGTISFTRRDPALPGHLRSEGNELEVSYSLLPAHWGNGYATEAVTAAFEWAADVLPDQGIVLCTQLANERSRRLALRLGFTEVERFEQHGAMQWFGSRPLRQSPG